MTLTFAKNIAVLILLKEMCGDAFFIVKLTKLSKRIRTISEKIIQKCVSTHCLEALFQILLTDNASPESAFKRYCILYLGACRKWERVNRLDKNYRDFSLAKSNDDCKAVMLFEPLENLILKRYRTGQEPIEGWKRIHLLNDAF
jgi:hypothetical protein